MSNYDEHADAERAADERTGWELARGHAWQAAELLAQALWHLNLCDALSGDLPATWGAYGSARDALTRTLAPLVDSDVADVMALWERRWTEKGAAPSIQSAADDVLAARAQAALDAEAARRAADREWEAALQAAGIDNSARSALASLVYWLRADWGLPLADARHAALNYRAQGIPLSGSMRPHTEAAFVYAERTIWAQA
jgi:hypothetical protein